MVSFTLEAVGRVVGGRVAPDDDDWGAVQASIELDAARFSEEALTGLAEFSHIEVVFVFHQLGEADVTYGARRPRGRADWPMTGVFAQRGRNRPNRLGVSVCRLLSVDGLSIRIAGLDATHGTPVLDIKPVISGFLPRGEIREPDWAREIMGQYW